MQKKKIGKPWSKVYTIVSIEFSPVVEIGVSTGHYFWAILNLVSIQIQPINMTRDWYLVNAQTKLIYILTSRSTAVMYFDQQMGALHGLWLSKS